MIKGLKRIPAKTLSLDPFFDEPGYWISIQPLRPYAKALCHELMLEGAEMEEKRAAGKPRPKTKGMNPKPVHLNQKSTAIRPVISADNTIEIRKIKLQYGVIEHNLTNESGKVQWNSELWDEIDEFNPTLLDYVVDQINELSFPEMDPS
jgi:hypothetical protein